MSERSIRPVLIGPGLEDLAGFLPGRMGAPMLAPSGAEGLRICRGSSATEPCCAIVGRHLPDMTGLEFLTKGDGPSCPVIFCLEDDPDRAFTREALAAGADRVLIRARLTADEMADAIEDALDRHAARAAVAWAADRERFRLASEAVKGMLYDWDPRTGRVDRSAGLHELCGFHPEDVPPDHAWWAGRMEPDDARRWDARLRDAVAERRPVLECEYRLRFRDGTERYIWDRTRLVYGAGGGLIRAVGYAMDVTDRTRSERALRDSELRLRKLAASDVIGIVFANFDGGLTYVNDEFLRIVGYSRSEFEARRIGWAELTPPEWLEIDRHKIDESRDRESCPPYEKEYIRKDGTRVPVSVGFARISDDAAVAIVFDQTPRRRAEKALKDADRRKDEFIATLGHELRNPLAAIGTAANVLRMKAPDDPELNWCRDVIFRQVRHLTRLIDDLLDVSRIANGKIRFKPTEVDLRSTVRRAAEGVQAMAASRDQVLEIHLPDHPLMALADPARIEQVVSNLLANAAKFTGDGGAIRLTAASEPGFNVIRVKDSGVGISANVLPTIFDLFAQGDCNPDRSQGGLGIGLTLVKSLIEKHGGTVEAASDGPGLGSEFTVRIPSLSPPDDPDDRPGDGGTGEFPAMPTARHRVRVLVIDDNKDIALGMARMVEMAGHEVVIAHDATIALEAARRFRPEYVLMDIALPGMNGYDLAESFRKDAALGGAILIAISGYAPQGDSGLACRPPFDHHLLKPVDASALLPLLAATGDRGTQP
ncbi:MAG: ATP-binding protein [Isosphaeraceae bacterium]